jgi:hypothetical protein
MSEKLKALRDQLYGREPGPVPDVAVIERMLMECWPELEITTQDGNLEPYKLLNRTEELTWDEPFITFGIERHGATVNGSVYAEVHSWKVNVTNGTAILDGAKRRQVEQKEKRLNVKPLAEEIAALIVSGKEDGRLRWTGKDRVGVEIAKIIPATNQQTTSGRRKRFRTELCHLVQQHGWKMITVNNFCRMQNSPEHKND